MEQASGGSRDVHRNGSDRGATGDPVPICVLIGSMALAPKAFLILHFCALTGNRAPGSPRETGRRLGPERL
jgi:hypothetical protein